MRGTPVSWRKETDANGHTYIRSRKKGIPSFLRVIYSQSGLVKTDNFKTPYEVMDFVKKICEIAESKMKNGKAKRVESKKDVCIKKKEPKVKKAPKKEKEELELEEKKGEKNEIRIEEEEKIKDKKEQ